MVAEIFLSTTMFGDGPRGRFVGPFRCAMEVCRNSRRRYAGQDDGLPKGNGEAGTDRPRSLLRAFGKSVGLVSLVYETRKRRMGVSIV